MRSTGTAEFWRRYHLLPAHVREQARKAYQQFLSNPDHPGLRFKRLQGPDNLWSVRVGQGYRAICLREGDRVTWDWIGTRQAFAKEW